MANHGGVFNIQKLLQKTIFSTHWQFKCGIKNFENVEISRNFMNFTNMLILLKFITFVIILNRPKTGSLKHESEAYLGSC